jgi:broad specificity phosphatase PhoE
MIADTGTGVAGRRATAVRHTGPGDRHCLPVCSQAMELLLIRHGQPAWSKDGRSVDDPDLTELGHIQATRVADRLAGLQVDHLFVSPLRRAHQTVAPLAEGLGMEPVQLDWLAEISAPRFEGTPIEQVERVFADSRARPIEEHWDGIPGGESFTDFHARVTGGLDALLGDLGAAPMRVDPRLWDFEPSDKRIVVVAHAGTNSVALGHLLGITPVPWEWERFVSFHASISTVQPLAVGGAQAFSLQRFADVAHLPSDIQTR